MNHTIDETRMKGISFFKDNFAISQQTCSVEPRFSALNMTLPAAAARAPAVLDRYMPHAPDLSSKPAARRRCCQSTGQTDGQTPDRYSNPASHTVAKS